jgi:hypothetical protein
VNCLDFRRRWLTVPNARDLALAQHERACAGCRQFARRGSVFESRLREALAIDVPAGLIDGIKQRRDIVEQVRSRQARLVRYAQGASVCIIAVFVAMLSYQMLGADPHAPALHRGVLAHIAAEQAVLRTRDAPSEARARQLFARYGAQLRGSLGEVKFAGVCRERDFQGVHLVLRGRDGPVTVLYMDGEDAEDTSYFWNDRYDGIVFPVDGGSIAVVGKPGEAIDSVGKLLRGNLRWNR